MMFSLNVKDLFLMIFFLTMLFPLLGTEQEKRDIALFRLSAGEYQLPEVILQSVDLEIGKAVVSSSMYGVWPVGIALTQDGRQIKDALQELAKTLQAASDKPDTLPETVRIGRIDVPKSLCLQLLQSEYILVPVITEVREELEKRDGQERFKITIRTDFYVMATTGGKIVAERVVQTMGYDREKARAAEDALRNIPPLLAYEIGQVNELKTGTIILGVSGDEVIIEQGGAAGAYVGQEYVIRGSEQLPSGQIASRDKALITVIEVTEKVALGQVRYSAAPIEVGDAVEEVRRVGLELSPYSLTRIPIYADQELASYVGVRLTLARWVTGLRPLVEAEFQVYPFDTYSTWFPVRFHAGAELRLFFGPIELAAIPTVGLEEWISLSAGESSKFEGFGLRGLVEFSLLVSRDVKVFASGGYEYWFGGRNGALASGGLSIKL